MIVKYIDDDGAEYCKYEDERIQNEAYERAERRAEQGFY